MYIGYPDAEETDGKSRGGGRCIIVSTIPNHWLFTAYYNLHKHLEHNTICIQHSSRTQHSSLKPSTTTVLKVGPSIYFRLLLNQIRYWNADKNTSTHYPLGRLLVRLFQRISLNSKVKIPKSFVTVLPWPALLLRSVKDLNCSEERLTNWRRNLSVYMLHLSIFVPIGITMYILVTSRHVPFKDMRRSIT